MVAVVKQLPEQSCIVFPITGDCIAIHVANAESAARNISGIGVGAMQ
ncbi:MAG: hypothetical protein WCP07_05310 [bacterium]